MDTRATGKIVMLFWFVPQMAEGSAEGQAMLDKYVVIGVVRGRL